MPELHFVGGPLDGTVVDSDQADTYQIPIGYRIRTWTGDPSHRFAWERADLATFIHADLKAAGDDAVFDALARHWDSYLAGKLGPHG